MKWGWLVVRERREESEEKLCEMSMESKGIVFIKREINKSGYMFFVMLLRYDNKIKFGEESEEEWVEVEWRGQVHGRKKWAMGVINREKWNGRGERGRD